MSKFKYEVEFKTTHYETFRIERETPLTDEERDRIEEDGEDAIPENFSIENTGQDEIDCDCVVTEVNDRKCAYCDFTYEEFGSGRNGDAYYNHLNACHYRCIGCEKVLDNDKIEEHEKNCERYKAMWLNHGKR